jgi:hypothetical protein
MNSFTFPYLRFARRSHGNKEFVTKSILLAIPINNFFRKCLACLGLGLVNEAEHFVVVFLNTSWQVQLAIHAPLCPWYFTEDSIQHLHTLLGGRILRAMVLKLYNYLCNHYNGTAEHFLQCCRQITVSK